MQRLSGASHGWRFKKSERNRKDLQLSGVPKFIDQAMSFCHRQGLRAFATLTWALAAIGCSDSPQPSSPAAPSPPAERSLRGVVVESGTRAPVPDARVCIWQQTNGDEHGGNCVQTAQDGSYRIIFSSPVVGNCPWVSAADFEGRQDCMALGIRETVWNTNVQRIIRIEAGQTIATTTFADEKVFSSEEYCTPCKRIRILVVRAGTLTVRLMPENAGLQLGFIYYKQRPNEPFPVQAGQDLPITVISPTAPRSFELATDFVPD
jgi:hypothetical protein